MTTEMQARERFETYDELRGPDLDAAHWVPARLALPTGDHIPLDPNDAPDPGRSRPLARRAGLGRAVAPVPRPRRRRVSRSARGAAEVV